MIMMIRRRNFAIVFHRLIKTKFSSFMMNIFWDERKGERRWKENEENLRKSQKLLQQMALRWGFHFPCSVLLRVVKRKCDSC